MSSVEVKIYASYLCLSECQYKILLKRNQHTIENFSLGFYFYVNIIKIDYHQ